MAAVFRRIARRMMSNIPENTVYGGPKPQSPSQRVTLTNLQQKHGRGDPITMVTAYDYPSAVHIDSAGIDVCLVGDSAAMVVHGHDTTLPISLDEMLVHCRAVARGASRPLLVGDLPFGSYESSSSQAVETAVRVLKEGGMDAIKLEGGAPSRISAAKAIVEAGIAVMGHVGLTPQAISVLGGFRPQGRTVASAIKVVETAMALQEAGCFSVVLECVPAPVAAAATSALQIPTIGIGAGPFCSGQVRCREMKRADASVPCSSGSDADGAEASFASSGAAVCYSIEIKDTILPPWIVAGICAAMSADGRSFESSFTTEPTSLGLNHALDSICHKSEPSVDSDDILGIPQVVPSTLLRSATLTNLKYSNGSYVASVSPI